ncbi:hypothetical protein BA895_22255 [Humibacillus sp. DSM 29435]|nr:hypothetical protein BA895_22255 [Humibacillus sp. DSM 29435]
MIGGGPDNGTSPHYVKALDHLLDEVEGQPWQLWWSGAPFPVLEIWFWFDDTKPIPRVRAANGKVTASINRPAPQQLKGPDGVAQARSDVVALAQKLRARFGLGDLPDLADIDTLNRIPTPPPAPPMPW